MALTFLSLLSFGVAHAAFGLWPPAGHVKPAMLLGPTANLPGDIANQTLALLLDGKDSWKEVRSDVTSSNGTLHLRKQVLTAFMNSQQRQILAKTARDMGVELSMEAGGALCGSGSGAQNAEAVLNGLESFIDADGTFKYIALESVFSRTHASCKEQNHSTTAEELAAYASVMATGFPRAKFYLYDALPHYRAGNFPANIPAYDLDLSDILTLLRTAMVKKGTELAGYWMDCPFEYSENFPSGLDGFEKIAKAVQIVKAMGLEVGKTFNSQAGGQSSDEQFYKSTLADFQKTTAVVPSAKSGGFSFDHIMVETWYPHPLQAAPESTPYTTTYTARAIFRQVSQSLVV